MRCGNEQISLSFRCSVLGRDKVMEHGFLTNSIKWMPEQPSANLGFLESF